MTVRSWCALSLAAMLITRALQSTSAVGAAALSQTAAAAAAPAGYAITGVAVVDVEQGLVRRDQTVIVLGDRIQRIGLRASVPVQKNLRVIDGRGQFLMPGLVDSHVHFADPPVFGRVMIANGVLTVRDMGQPNDSALALRQALNTGAMLGPEMLVTGSILDGVPPFIPSVSIGVKTPDEGRAAVRKQAEAGVDQIKIYSRLEKDVFLAIINEAKRVGLKPVGHVPESVYVEDAAAAGQRSIEHLHGFGKLIGRLLGEPVVLKTGGMGTDIDFWPRLADVNRDTLRTTLRRMAATGVVVCPTGMVFKAQAGLTEQAMAARTYPMSEYVSPVVEGYWKAFWNPSQRTLMEQTWPPMAAFVAELHRAGVTLMVGTDLLMAGVIPGYSVHEEMALWQAAGIPTADVLRSATIVPARFMGRDSRVGTVAEGKVASLVLVRANPLEDIRHARQIEGVFLRGRYFSRADLDQLLKEAKDLAAPPQTAPPTARPALVLTYVANSGVLVAAGDRKILIDALFDRPNPAYRAPSPETIDRMVNGIAPFDGVTAALVTHNHPDHFDPRVALRFLERRRDAVLVAPGDAVAAMRSAAADWPQVAPRVVAIEGPVGERGMRDVRGVSVTTFRTRHGSSDAPPNVMYLVDVNGWRLFHEGDSPGDVADYRRFGLGTEPVDLALVHQWFAFEPACAAFLQQVLRPDHIALTHLPIDREAETPAKLDAVRKSYRDVFLLVPGMAPKAFPGGPASRSEPRFEDRSSPERPGIAR